MIGQKNLQSQIERLIENDTFPRFSILVGPKGSGKKTFANWIITRIVRQESLSYSQVCPDVKIDTIRQIIENVYKTISTNIYIIPDADNMSNAAKNALLKVTEEPPNNAYFIMTLEDENNTLETIKSRATIFHMDRYTPDEIREYCVGKGENQWIVNTIITDLCETLGDVNLLIKMNPKEFYDYVQLVVDNIAEVSLANAFKISSKIVLKDGDTGYDLRLFWKAFMRVSFDIDKYDGVCITSKYLQKLRVRGINKQMLFDTWMLEIRERWM